MDSVEASGKSIEDAILQALARLGRNRDEVDITVLQEPSRGTRGMGAREARVRVFVRAQGPAGYAANDVEAPDDELEQDDYEVLDDEAAEPGYYVEEDVPPSGAITSALKDALPEDASIEEIAVTALEAILVHMGVNAAVETADTPEDEPLLLNVVPVTNQPLSILIGRRGETLAALQLIVNLITSKQAGERERITVDVAGYRDRRESNLRSMAQRIADQVRASGRAITLEAMPPNERRIIHMELAEQEDISTESTGEGDQRRIVISLKRGVRA